MSLFQCLCSHHWKSVCVHTHYVLKSQMCHCTFKISIITFISVRVYITYVEYSEVLQVMRVITVNGNSARLC